MSAAAWRGRVGVAVAAALLAAKAAAQTAPPVPGDEVTVNGRAIAQIGVAESGSQGTVGYDDFEDRPLGRVGELIENVPGVIATQHSGTGKANQYFLRGFNLDHGTDLAGFVDGVPINLRSHGHGQGYMDLNFLIPELVERIDYRKGPYFADVGDFSAAGTVRFVTKSSLPAPLVEATGGSFGYGRALAAGSGVLGAGTLLAAVEGTVSDGPWVLAERLRKINGLAKYSSGTADAGWDLGLTAYHASWRATDQVPLRAITSGLIGRYGNIDPYLGGATTRIGLTANGAWSGTRVNLFALYYRFRLTSNFTYFLDDPVHGDEFQQRDQRGVFGGSIRHDLPMKLSGLPLMLTVGGDARLDHIGKVGLYHSEHGVATGTVSQDRVDEYSGGLYAQGQLTLTERLRLIAGLRGDAYGYGVRAEITPANSGQGGATLISPKAALAWRPADGIELYANYGESFHSNDVRGAAIRVNPTTGDPADRVPVLIKARGAELGARVETGRFTGSLVGYNLTLGSELVYAGDEGTTEPNAASHRYGAEAAAFWRPNAWLTLDASGSLTHARFTGVAADARYIPNSVGRVIAAGAELRLPHGLSGSLHVRHFGPAPLIEDNSERSTATTLVNIGGYARHGRARLVVEVLNLLDSRADDITYFYTSRLPGEPAEGVDGEHLHPVEPREARVSVSLTF